MKNSPFSRLTALVAAMLLMLLLPFGCAEDPCEAVDCQNGGCLEGTCACDTGFEGDQCQTRSRDRFLGEWEVGDICRVPATVYDASIEAGNADNGLVINNLNEAGLPVDAVVEGLSIDLPVQEFGLAAISGAGGIDTLAQVISIEYRITEDGQPDQVCQATFRKP